jgi:hypothetical protein
MRGEHGEMLVAQSEHRDHATPDLTHWRVAGTGSNFHVGEDCGVTLRALRDIFEWVGVAGLEVSVSISYLQIYCEILQDLLDPANGNNLSIREKDGRVYVEGLSKIPVTVRQRYGIPLE